MPAKRHTKPAAGTWQDEVFRRAVDDYITQRPKAALISPPAQRVYDEGWIHAAATYGPRQCDSDG
jgi:hypothetical protein